MDAQIAFNSQLIVSNVQMFIVLITVCLFGLVFGYIQTAIDPESHKGAMAIMFGIDLEITESWPIGMAMGMVIGFIVEYIRQQEIQNRPKGKNSLESLLENYRSPTLDGMNLNFDDDEERISLIQMPLAGS